jgi:hypothetical protein
MAGVPLATAAIRVLLLGSIESALERVQGDPDRGLSKDTDFLRAAYDRAEEIKAEQDKGAPFS